MEYNMMDDTPTTHIKRETSEGLFVEESPPRRSISKAKEKQYTAENGIENSSDEFSDGDALLYNPPRKPNKGPKNEQGRARAVPVRNEEKENIVGHHVYEPSMLIFARIGHHGGAEYRAQFSKFEYPVKIQKRWALLVLRNGFIQADKVVLSNAVSKGIAPSIMDESTKKRLTKEYLLQLAKDTEGDNSIYRYGSEHSSSTKAPVLSTSRAEIVVGAFEENNKVPVFATLTRTGNPLYKMEIDPDRNSVLVKRTTVDYDQIAFTETMDQEENQDTKAFLVATLGAQNDLPDDNEASSSRTNAADHHYTLTPHGNNANVASSSGGFGGGSTTRSQQHRSHDAGQPQEVLIGHHINEPQLYVYAAVGSGGFLEFRPHREEASQAIQGRWATLVPSSQGRIALNKIVLRGGVLQGAGSRLSEQAKRDKIKEYVEARLDSMPPRADLTSNIGVDMEKRAMEKVLDIRTKQLLNAEMRNMEQQNEIKALRATIDGDPTLAGDFIIPNPSRNLAVNIQIGGKLYGEIPAGMPNAGLYVEIDGKIKGNYREKTVLGEYKEYKMGYVVEDSVMIKGLEFCRTADGLLVQKQEDLVEIGGRTYIRRRTLAPYHGEDAIDG